MTGLFASGHIIDAILLLVACEAGLLALWGRGRLALRPLLFNLASGAALMLAVRGALTQAPWWSVAACLFAACLAHATELRLRLRRATKACDACGKSSPPATGTRPESVAFPGHESREFHF